MKLENPKPYFLVFVCILFFGSIGYGQEICDNGIDDDGDGLIDLNDSLDCTCKVDSTVVVSSLVPNPSFEEKICCPSFHSQLNCAKNWVQASAATSDYFNTCDYIGETQHFGQLAPPPKYGGKGYVGFYDALISNNIYKEYIGTCLESDMVAGQKYQVEFYMAYGQGPSDINVSLFATDDCANLPFGGIDNYFGCPTNGPGWDEVASVHVILQEKKWNLVRMVFTPTKNYSGVVLGSSCQPMSQLPVKPYYYLDHFVVNKSELFGNFSLYEEHSPCSGKTVLSFSNEMNTASIQWYRDGIALVGETDSFLELNSSGKYLARLDFGDSCKKSKVYVYDPDKIETPFISILDSIEKCTQNRYLVVDYSFNPTAIQWSKDGLLLAGETEATLDCTNQSGVFIVTVTSRDSCSFSDTISIEPLVQELFYIRKVDTVVNCKREIYLEGNVKGQIGSYDWFKNDVLLDGEHDHILRLDNLSFGSYTAGTYTQDSCYVTHKISISQSGSVDPCPTDLKVYNIITPGTDGENDAWVIDFEGYSNIQVDIYNRWGELIYGYNLPGDSHWNGRVRNVEQMCPDGTYFYILKLKNQYSNVVTTQNGLIELVTQ